MYNREFTTAFPLITKTYYKIFSTNNLLFPREEWNKLA